MHSYSFEVDGLQVVAEYYPNDTILKIRQRKVELSFNKIIEFRRKKEEEKEIGVQHTNNGEVAVFIKRLHNIQIGCISLLPSQFEDLVKAVRVHQMKKSSK